MFNKLENKKGVTLVELLAVVVIMGIVAAIAVPTIGGLIARQQANADEATFVQIQEAARLYAVDDADGVFNYGNLVNDVDLRSNLLKIDTDGNGVIETTDDRITLLLAGAPASGTDYDNLHITVVGSVVTFAYDANGDGDLLDVTDLADAAFDLYINNTLVD